MAHAQTGRTAIVMGASIAGLWAARVLSDHFETVLVLERDRLPAEAEFRAGTPQARQYHIMLLRGLQIMDSLFPGMRQELLDAGAVQLDSIGDVAVRARGTWLEQFRSGQILLGCSRVLVEAIMRRRLRSIPQIQFVERVEVLGLEADSAHTMITGVRIHDLDTDAQADVATRTIQADFVVDALGRRSPTGEWLVQLGYPAPAESQIDSFLGYVTRRYRKPDSVQDTWHPILIQATPPEETRGGLIFPEEGGTWVVMMAGVAKDYPPVEEAGFQAFARSLGPELFQVVATGEPLTKPYGYRNTDSRWRHYERLERWPERLVVLGDAFCGFNPIYGQGMTVAALSAVALGQELREAGGQLNGIGRRTLQAITKVTADAWLLATGADLEWPTTVGGGKSNAPADRFARWYLGRLLDALGDDRVLRLAFLDVNQLIKPATSLFAPGLVLRVLRHGLVKR